MPGRAVSLYVGVLCALALPISVAALAQTDSLLQLACFGFLFFLVEQLKPPPIGGGKVGVATSIVVATATYPVLGMWGAAACLACGLVRRPGHLLIRRLYNVAQYVVCTFLGGAVYVGLGGAVGTDAVSAEAFPYVLVPITAGILTFELANVLLLSGVLRLDTGRSLIRIIRSTFAEAVVASIAYAYLGLLMAALWLGRLGPAAAFLMLVPLLVARWATAQYAAEQKAHQATLKALAQAIETKDLYTRGHGERVSRAARLLGAELGWEGDRLDALAQAGLLHDVGKIGVSTRVLQKDGKLTDDEYDTIKMHPLHGVAVVGDIAFLEDARTGIMHHHERFDGSGYPAGLAGTHIPVFARILGIADAFDCMTSVRSYRPARPVQEAIDELIRCKGSHFDPDLVDLFVKAVQREGWEVAPVQELPVERYAGYATYDHDDPAHPPQIEGSRP